MKDLATQTRWMDATAQAELVANGDVTPVELVDAAIERMESLDGDLNALTYRWFDTAREMAGSPAFPDGPFKGVPFLLKDLHAHMEGMPMSNGSAALKEANYHSTIDTTIVSRFKAAGLVICGRTNSPEMGTVPVTEPVAWGPTRNPWNTDHTPGGSSGGASAAVASGMVPMAHASDGGGSIRIPAACAGLVGLKTSQGRISTGPHRAETGLGVELAVSHSVRDTARLLDAVAGPGTGDSVIAPASPMTYTEALARDPGTLRIGILAHHPRGGTVSNDCVEAAESAGRMLESLGHSVEYSFPHILTDPDTVSRFMALWAVGAAMNVKTFSEMLGREITADDMELMNWVQAEFAQNMSGVDYATALAGVASYRRECLQWWADGFDILVTPTLGETPPKIGEHDNNPDRPMDPMRRAAEWIPFTPPFNTTGQPAISLPLHVAGNGLPVGVQFVADYGRDDLLISLAAQLERAFPWGHIEA
ncbi:MAG: amidase [Ilumatobacteraceae bacterium]